jgi:hypothetical protein
MQRTAAQLRDLEAELHATERAIAQNEEQLAATLRELAPDAVRSGRHADADRLSTEADEAQRVAERERARAQRGQAGC